MAFLPLDLDDLASGKPVDETLMEQIKDNFDYLNGAIGSAGETGIIKNGSFEIDSDSDGVPDQWTFTNYPGGTGTLVTSADAHGANAFKITHPGGASNGGGYLESDYIECSEYIRETIHVIMWDTASAKNEIEIRFFTDAKVYISSDTVYSTTTLGATAENIIRAYDPPSTARFLKIRLIGGFTDTDSAGDTYFGFVGKNRGVLPTERAGYRSSTAVSVAWSAAEVNNNTTSPVKVKDIIVTRDGVLDVYFQLKSAGTITAYGRIYVNGAAVGTTRSTTSTTYIAYTEDIEVLAGDNIQLYLWVSSGIASGYIQNFYLRSDILYTEQVVL